QPPFRRCGGTLGPRLPVPRNGGPSTTASMPSRKCLERCPGQLGCLLSEPSRSSRAASACGGRNRRRIPRDPRSHSAPIGGLVPSSAPAPTAPSERHIRKTRVGTRSGCSHNLPGPLSALLRAQYAELVALGIREHY